MSIRLIALAGAAAFALNSCATAPQQTITAESLLSAPYIQSSAEAFDVSAFLDALPAWVDASMTGARFDETTGAMVVDDLVFALRDAPNYRLRVARAQFWNGDASAMASVFNGSADQAAMADIFDRASFEGVQSEGLQWENGQVSASLTADKIVFDGFAARSFELAEKEGAPEAAAMLRSLAAMSSSYAMDGAAYSNVSFRLNDSQGNEILTDIAQAFVRGYEAGALEYERIDGMSYSIKAAANNPVTAAIEVAFGLGQENSEQEESAESKILQPHMREVVEKAIAHPVALMTAAYEGETVSQEVDTFEVWNYDISGGLEWLARWELPPITETELIDFGSMAITGDRSFMNGKLISTTDRAEIAAYDFYWLVPSDLQVNVIGNTTNLLEYLDASVGDLTPETGSQEFLQMREAIIAMGLETITADYDMNWNWNGETGALSTGMGADVLDFAASSFGVDLTGPNLTEWDNLARSNASDDVVASKLGLGGFSYSLTDDQMLDRLFAFAAQQSGGGTAEELRATVPVMLRASGAQAAQMNPRISGYIDAIANFIETGGTIDINAAPVAPVPLMSLGETAEKAPETLPDVLDLTITHSN